MNQNGAIAKRISRAAERTKDIFDIQPLIELAGTKRVLIEHHQGIREYGTQRITVSVKYGSVCICGCDLVLMHMSGERLVITGKIHSVHLQNRGC